MQTFFFDSLLLDQSLSIELLPSLLHLKQTLLFLFISNFLFTLTLSMLLVKHAFVLLSLLVQHYFLLLILLLESTLLFHELELTLAQLLTLFFFILQARNVLRPRIRRRTGVVVVRRTGLVVLNDTMTRRVRSRKNGGIFALVVQRRTGDRLGGTKGIFGGAGRWMSLMRGENGRVVVNGRAMMGRTASREPFTFFGSSMNKGLESGKGHFIL